ncbi:FAD/NAD(P)-binding domain-containing protein [Fistulina hepatica ATCC 64428]|uniref:FAD/NAD(P)-binding domain-containing protein n=1 Tax=Fistulina hepatica ATCC 64428 TaxID=1128425 RepID=A0A0D7AGM2_9AGAR|nr:FAD/NAD(P)-binding domain-containing protein [Fistulina hepatica ATCC 64428]
MASKKNDDPKKIVIVGSGGGGKLAKALGAQLDPAKYSLTLVEARDYFVYLPATARIATTDKGHLEDKAFVPLDRIFEKGRGTVVRGRVTAVDPATQTIKLNNGDTIAYDALVLATGSKWVGVLDLPDDPEDVKAFVAKSRSQIKNAKSIALLGGGSVGIELAGEIKETYPGKKVTIIQAFDKLLNPIYPDRFRCAFESRLAAMGIDVVYNEFVDAIPEGDYANVQTRSGKQIEADLVLPAWGPKPATGYLDSSFLDSNGRVKVKPTLQTVGYDNIFAMGDVTDIKEAKQAAKNQYHVPTVQQNIVAYFEGGKMKEYTGGREMIVVTVGSQRGVGFFQFLWGIVLGDWFARPIKSRTLMIPQARVAYGYEA